MTAFASAILAALPGAGAQPEKAGAGATGGESVLGVFEAMLAGLTEAITGGAAEGGKADAGLDLAAAQPDGLVVDTTLAGASNVLPFAPLATGLAATQEEAVTTSEPVEAGATATPATTATVADLAADSALSADGDQPAASASATVASATPETAEAADTDTAARDASATAPQASTPQSAPAAASSTGDTAAAKANAPAPVEVVTASEASASQPTAELPADADLSPPPPVADASRAAAPTAASTTAAAIAAASATPARPAETPKTQPAVAKVDAAPAATAAAGSASTAPQAAPATDTVAAAASAMAADVAEAQVEAAPAVAAVVTPPRSATSAGETRRTASAAAASVSAKGDQTATAVFSYLDGLDGVEPKAGEEVAVNADAGADATPDIAAVPLEVVEIDEPERQAPAADVRAAAAPAAGTAAEAPAASRMSAETVAKLSADIVRKLEGQSTKFDLQLDPHGMGKVDVSVEIDRDGRLTAALSFDSAQAASDLKSRSAELRTALEQAGFEVSDSGLSFDMASQGGGFGGREAGEQSRTWSGRAFQTAQSGLDEADARAALSSNSRAASGGVDIRI